MTPSYTTWPRRNDTRKQPWEDPEESGITPRAGLPLLASGSADPAVHTIFSALARLGYETPVSRGENPVGIVGPEELAAVRQFRHDYGVQEDPTLFGGENEHARQIAENHIGPWTGEAIMRAAEQLDAKSDDGPTFEALVERVNALEQREATAKVPDEGKREQSTTRKASPSSRAKAGSKPSSPEAKARAKS